MTLTRCHFAQADLIASGWFDVGPTPLASQTLQMPMYCQPFFIKYRVGPTLVRYDKSSHYLFFSEILFSFLSVVAFRNLFDQQLQDGIPLAFTVAYWCWKFSLLPKHVINVIDVGEMVKNFPCGMVTCNRLRFCFWLYEHFCYLFWRMKQIFHHTMLSL